MGGFGSKGKYPGQDAFGEWRYGMPCITIWLISAFPPSSGATVRSAANDLESERIAALYTHLIHAQRKVEVRHLYDSFPRQFVRFKDVRREFVR